MNVKEFELRIMARLSNIESMGAPKRHVIGQDVTLIYPMTDNFDMTAVTTEGKVRLAVITVRNVNQGNFATAILLYDAVVSAYADADSVFGALKLDETIFFPFS